MVSEIYFILPVAVKFTMAIFMVTKFTKRASCSTSSDEPALSFSGTTTDTSINAELQQAGRVNELAAERR